MSSPALRQAGMRRMLPFPGSPKLDRVPNLEELCGKEDIIKEYLLANEGFMRDFVLEHISLESIQSWLQEKRKQKRTEITDDTSVRQGDCGSNMYTDTDLVLIERNLLSVVKDQPDFLPMMQDVLNVISSGIKAETCSMFVIKSGTKDLCLYVPSEKPGGYTLKQYGPVGAGTTVAAYVAAQKKAVKIQDLSDDERFPQGIGLGDSLLFSVICLPVILPTNDVLAVMQFVRSDRGTCFSEEEFQLVISYSSWLGISMYEIQVTKALNSQIDVNEFLLDVSKIIFDDVVQLDSLIEKIMVYTKNLVNADRCALFLVDEDEEEMFCNLFDEGRYKDGRPVFSKGEEIRFAWSKGIAGVVARSGEIVNIKDPYNHPLFNREIDRQTGYITKNILCMPIISKGKTIGVVQMLNKLAEGGFTGADETSFKMFSVYCAVALHYSKIYGHLLHKSTQYQVAMEQLTFHVNSDPHEKDAFLKHPYIKRDVMPRDIINFYFTPDPQSVKSDPLYLCKLYMHMMKSLFKRSFEVAKMCSFVLAVKKNYRPVAYHNWQHGWTVAHGMFCMLKKLQDTNTIPVLRKKALMVAALCHDLDHRGFNNSFLQRFNEPLAQLYKNSTLENHHYNLTVLLMQQEGNEIFAGRITPDEYKELLQYINHAIMATNVTQYLKVGRPLEQECTSSHFSLQTANLDALVTALMTGADNIVLCKDWDTQKQAVIQLYEEYYIQGDKEREQGCQPPSVMDRKKKIDIPRHQAMYMKSVSLPCYKTLSVIFPVLAPLFEACLNNLSQWERIISGECVVLWEPLKSLSHQQQVVWVREGEESLKGRRKSQTYKQDKEDHQFDSFGMKITPLSKEDVFESMKVYNLPNFMPENTGGENKKADCCEARTTNNTNTNNSLPLHKNETTNNTNTNTSLPLHKNETTNTNTSLLLHKNETTNTNPSLPLHKNETTNNTNTSLQLHLNASINVHKEEIPHFQVTICDSMKTMENIESMNIPAINSNTVYVSRSTAQQNKTINEDAQDRNTETNQDQAYRTTQFSHL